MEPRPQARRRRGTAVAGVALALAAIVTGCAGPPDPGPPGSTTTTTEPPGTTAPPTDPPPTTAPPEDPPPSDPPPTTVPPEDPPSPEAGEWPGANGVSGVNGDPVIDRESVEAFCTWRGRPCPIAHVYTERSSWEKMTNGNGWLYGNFEGFPGRLVISQGLVPQGRQADMVACADGAYDANWRNFGAEMVANGRADSIVRLGWEFNGTFMAWSALDTDDYVQCWRHAALAIRAGNPDVTMDWTINAHSTPAEACDGLSTNCYPGDDVVDIVGIDNYDQGPSVSSAAEFAEVAERPEGLTWIYGFAQDHGKPLSVGEWGVAPGSAWNDDGENPEFIRWMHDWFAERAPGIAYEAYFNNCQASELHSNIYRPASGDCVRENAAAGDVYQELWGT